MSLTSKCPSCGHTHIVRPAIGQGAHGAGVIVLEHEQLALQGAELFALRQFKAGVPWEDLYTCILLANRWDDELTPDEQQTITRAASWHDVNEPEAQP